MAARMNFSTTPLSKVPHTEVVTNSDRPLVLVVDDEVVIADTLALILNQFGFATMTAYDSESALEIAAVTPPDLLICELALPKMNGFELARAITATVPDCNVVLVSGRASSINIRESAGESYDFVFLNKPFHPTVLLTQISNPLKKRSENFRVHLMGSQDTSSESQIMA
jgi:DNA-binding response OmpR family regulator